MRRLCLTPDIGAGGTPESAVDRVPEAHPAVVNNPAPISDMIDAESKLKGVQRDASKEVNDEKAEDRKEQTEEKEKEGLKTKKMEKEKEEEEKADSSLVGFSFKELGCTLTKVFDASCKTLQGFGAGAGTSS